MHHQPFTKPIYLKDGKYLIREIATIIDAIYFLQDWPEADRDIMHEAALRTCFMAHDGLKPMNIARDAIRSFGRKKGILVKGPEVAPWMVKPDTSGRIPA